MTLSDLRSRKNVVPSAYRGIAVVTIDQPITEAFLIQHFVGREIYRRTRFLVVHGSNNSVALIRVDRVDDEPLFSQVREIEILAMPDECTYLKAPSVDTAIPSNLARIAVEQAPGYKAVIIEGLYSHVNFIVNAAPLYLRVTEVTPPFPAKLFDQVQRLLAVAENLPPIIAELDAVTFDQLVSTARSTNYLLPCRGSYVTIPGATTHYLDERPPREDWTLIGCDRSLQIHEWFYGDTPASVSICPRKRTDMIEGPTLVKCCLLENGITLEGGRVVVPWGATLADVNEALGEIAKFWEPTWAPV